MKLSQVPDRVKRLLLATCHEDVEVDDLEELSNDELTFLTFYALQASSLARLVLAGRKDVNARALDVAGNPWGDERIELDELLPAPTRPASLARPELADCQGEREANRRLCLSPADIGDYFDAGYYRREILGARYADVYERELHFGWPAPDYEAWAATQDVPRASRARARLPRDARGRFVAKSRVRATSARRDRVTKGRHG